MFEPGARRFARRMERIAEADQASDLSLVRHHTGDAAAQRFAADYKLPASTERLNYLAPCIKQHRLTVRRASRAMLAARAHIGELKAHNAQIAARQRLRDGCHERRIHRCTGAVGEHER